MVTGLIASGSALMVGGMSGSIVDRSWRNSEPLFGMWRLLISRHVGPSLNWSTLVLQLKAACY